VVKITQAEENYIKAIYKLQQDSATVSTNALAAALQTRPASVTDMARKLKHKQLVKYERYQGIVLTANGQKTALDIIRRHRLWECFLVEKLKFNWEEVHEQAEELEHVKRQKLTERLSAFLDHPTTDPHGDPIPDSQGKMDKARQQSLLHYPACQPLRVTGVGDQASSLLEFLNQKGIGLGTHLEIVQRFAFDHSIEVKVSNQPPFILSAQVADNIFAKAYGKNSTGRKIVG
jgi:DtxR family Mn-dependent transcriptional regulator